MPYRPHWEGRDIVKYDVQFKNTYLVDIEFVLANIKPKVESVI